MRAGWRRHSAALAPTRAEVTALVRAALGAAAEVREVRPIGGGLVNTNLAADLAAPPWRVLLRYYQRDALHARKEVALARLLDGRVPVARFLHFAESAPPAGRPCAVLEWVEGERLDHAAEEGDAASLGAAAGEALARIHAIRFERPGFLTADLRVPTAIDMGGAGLRAFLRRVLLDGPGGARLGPDLMARLLDFAAREGDRLDAWPGPCLVHADFNPTNILVRREAGATRVAAVLDWEFALSATPALDFGNLLRPPLGARSGFVEGLARGYRTAGGALPEDWREIARIADLLAWADQLNARDADPALIADARAIIAATVAG